MNDAVLILENDSTHSTQLATLVEQSQAEAYEARDCAEARRILRELEEDQISPSIFLVDINLDGRESGLDFCRELRSSLAYADHPIIVITGSTSPAVLQEAFKAGATDYVIKGSTFTCVEEVECRLRLHRERFHKMQLLRLQSPVAGMVTDQSGVISDASAACRKLLQRLGVGAELSDEWLKADQIVWLQPSDQSRVRQVEIKRRRRYEQAEECFWEFRDTYPGLRTANSLLSFYDLYLLPFFQDYLYEVQKNVRVERDLDDEKLKITAKHAAVAYMVGCGFAEKVIQHYCETALTALGSQEPPPKNEQAAKFQLREVRSRLGLTGETPRSFWGVWAQAAQDRHPLMPTADPPGTVIQLRKTGDKEPLKVLHRAASDG